MAQGRSMRTITGLVAVTVGAALVLAFSPAFLAFAFATSGAGVWCHWLERNPESPDEAEQPVRP